MDATIRAAFEEDAETLAHIGAETFIATFGHLYSDKDLNHFLEKSHTPEFYRALLTDPEFSLWLAEDKDGEAIGYAVAGPCSFDIPEVQPGSGELGRLYLKKEAQGGGLGAKMLEVALDFLRDRFEHVYLSVFSENVPAQKLYQRFGFRKICDYDYMVGEQADRDWIMELQAD